MPVAGKPLVVSTLPEVATITFVAVNDDPTPTITSPSEPCPVAVTVTPLRVTTPPLSASTPLAELPVVLIGPPTPLESGPSVITPPCVARTASAYPPPDVVTLTFCPLMDEPAPVADSPQLPDPVVVTTVPPSVTAPPVSACTA